MNTIETASIVGGKGNFGKFILDQLTPCIQQAHSIDTNTITEDIPSMLHSSDLIIFATPIRHTASIIKNLSQHIVGDKLVIDISGLKTQSIQEITKLSVSEIISLHPMFKHNIDDFTGKKITKTTIQGGKKWQELENILEKKGFDITEISAQDHDNKMAVIQALPHITNMIFIETLRRLNIHPDDILQFSTPVYQAQSEIGGRFLNQSASLFADMQINNQEFKKNVLPELLTSVKTMNTIITSGDTHEFEKIFHDLGKFLGKKFLKKHK